jgi:large subunit ribosomal protein L25
MKDNDPKRQEFRHMTNERIVAAAPRQTKGSSSARRRRRAGKVPGVLYGQGAEAMLLELDEHDFAQELRRHSSAQVMVDLEVAGRPVQKVLVKDVQHHPFTGRILHVDLFKVNLTESLRVTVQVELVGDPIGVVRGGGVLESLVRELEVECLPSAIPEVISVDVTGLDIGQSLAVKDLRIDGEGVVILDDPTIAVAHVTAPRVGTGETEEGEEGGAPEDETST